jgi:hypothetical protein
MTRFIKLRQQIFDQALRSHPSIGFTYTEAGYFRDSQMTTILNHTITIATTAELEAYLNGTKHLVQHADDIVQFINDLRRQYFPTYQVHEEADQPEATALTTCVLL